MTAVAEKPPLSAGDRVEYFRGGPLALPYRIGQKGVVLDERPENYMAMVRLDDGHQDFFLVENLRKIVPEACPYEGLDVGDVVTFARTDEGKTKEDGYRYWQDARLVGKTGVVTARSSCYYGVPSLRVSFDPPYTQHNQTIPPDNLTLVRKKADTPFVAGDKVVFNELTENAKLVHLSSKMAGVSGVVQSVGEANSYHFDRLKSDVIAEVKVTSPKSGLSIYWIPFDALKFADAPLVETATEPVPEPTEVVSNHSISGPLEGHTFVNETRREYTYRSGQRLVVDNVIDLRVSAFGKHYLRSFDGSKVRLTIVAPEWIHIQIVPNADNWTL